MTAWSDAIAALTPMAWWRMSPSGGTIVDEIGSRDLAGGGAYIADDPVIFSDPSDTSMRIDTRFSIGWHLSGGATTWSEDTSGEWTLVVVGQGASDTHLLIPTTSGHEFLIAGISGFLTVQCSGPNSFEWSSTPYPVEFYVSTARWMVILTLKAGDLHCYLAKDFGGGISWYTSLGAVVGYGGGLDPIIGQFYMGGTSASGWNSQSRDRHDDIVVLGQGLTATEAGTLKDVFALSGGYVAARLPKPTADFDARTVAGSLAVSLPRVYGDFDGTFVAANLAAGLPRVVAHFDSTFTDGDLEATLPRAVGAFDAGYISSVLVTGGGVVAVVGDSIVVTPELTVSATATSDRAPTIIDVAVAGGEPLATVTIKIDGDEVLTAVLNSAGAWEGPVGVAADDPGGTQGDHDLTVEQVALSGGTATGATTYSLLLAPGSYPVDVADDAPAVIVTTTVVPGTEIRRWMLQDLGGLGSYVFPQNPDTMTSPEFEKQLTSKHTTAGLTGRYHVFEGNLVKEWQFSGYAPTKEMCDALLAYRALRRRCYLVDHHNRAWKVVITHVELKPRLRHTFNGAQSDWGTDYNVTATILDPEWTVPA